LIFIGRNDLRSPLYDDFLVQIFLLLQVNPVQHLKS
jgi:hypothetical protein